MVFEAIAGSACSMTARSLSSTCSGSTPRARGGRIGTKKLVDVWEIAKVAELFLADFTALSLSTARGH
jgi:hypothetical protein